ncbi:hypothetical protein A3715_14695 [Oleiphilus sp. HI0009]|nr:hypothetical protein A3715_14695 [Oleiphilus sp. HI0009]
MSLRIGLPFKALLCATTFILSSPIFAEEAPLDQDAIEKPIDRYQIEFVLFKQQNPDLEVLVFEKVRTPIEPSSSNNFLYEYLYSSLTATQLLQPQKEDQRLIDIPRQFDEKGIDILARGAWQQEIDNDTRTLPIILTGSNIDLEEPTDLSENNDAKQMFGFEEFYGELTIRRSRYMHAEIDLDYMFKRPVSYYSLIDYLQDPFPKASFFQLLFISDEDLVSGGVQEDNGEIVIKSFNFNQSRRIKNNEIHYLDHPYLGLIVTISKLKLPEYP